jgi:hypothetical protein
MLFEIDMAAASLFVDLTLINLPIGRTRQPRTFETVGIMPLTRP